MLLLKFLLAAFLLFQGVAAQCGPPQCYNGCTDARPQVDFVFLIDVSGSMQPKIDGVKNGLTTFANSLNTNSISPKFSIVTFGATSPVAPRLRQQMTDFGPFKTSMDGISTGGGRECGLEAVSTSLGIASAGNLGLNFRTGSNTKKVFILVTNEDSDQASNSANIFSNTVGGTVYSQASAAYDGVCFNAQIDSTTWANSWQREINFVANGLITADASLYMFVGWTKSLSTNDVTSAQTCKTPFQYCNPDLQTQSANFSIFDATATLNTLRQQSLSQANSLQGLLLNAGKIARCFDVADTASSTLVNNFFSTIVSDVSQCQTCLVYPCSGSSCLAPVNICDCAGVRNGTKVRDSAGNCCERSELDCAGICNGNSRYDACGVCTANGALHPACVLDCNQTRWLNLPANPTSLSTYSNLRYITTCPDIAGYLIPNSDVITLYRTAGTQASVCNHYHTFGRFEGRTQCTMDTARYAADYTVLEASAKSDYLARLLTGTPRTAYCRAGTSFKVPSTRDSCGQCVTVLDTPPHCVRDCAGIFRNATDPPNFVDNCGYCVRAGSNPNARKDDCGVCDGGNSLKNECGVCGGVRGKDGCNQNLCLNLTCNVECDGVPRSTVTRKIDECGNCVPISAVRNATCVKDCSGTWFNNLTATSSPNIVDECGNCVPRATIRLPTCVQDCAGKWNGTAYYDACNQCVVDNKPAFPCKQDCRGNYYLEGAQSVNFTIDDCGNCRPNNSLNDAKDLCGICTNKAGYVSATQCTPDCKGIYRLIDSPDRAFTDSCRVCWFANQTSMRNYLLDQCGFCRESRDDPNWNSTNNGQDSQGKPCPCGSTPVMCPDNVTTTCTDSCPQYTLCPNSTKVPDDCGRCEGNTTYYGKPKDDCGLCCDPDNGVPCNQDKDDCGVCFGFNKDKQNPCGICLNIPGNKCSPDCLGVYGGNATYGCDGICNSKANCSFCGNGVIEAGETCDLGVNSNNVSLNIRGSGCAPNCVAEAGNNTGSIIGGIIGGIAAVAFLALAAFLAVRYAQKNGLIGNASGQNALNAPMDNPLYEQQSKVQNNPLYES